MMVCSPRQAGERFNSSVRYLSCSSSRCVTWLLLDAGLPNAADAVEGPVAQRAPKAP